MEDLYHTPSTTFRTFDFTGSGRDYFRIWIVNIALTILTLGIFSAWAKVRRLRYFYGHTHLDGHNFAYLADPVKILKGRILAVLLLLFYTGGTSLFPNLALYILAVAVLLVPLIIVTSSAFQMRNSAYRNLRFGFGGQVRDAYAALVPPLAVMLVIVAALYLTTDAGGVFDEDTGQVMTRADMLPSFLSIALVPVLPWLDQVRMRFVISNTRYANLQADFGGRVLDFYKLYIGALLMFVAASLVIAFAIGVIAGLARGAPGDPSAEPPVWFILLMLPLIYGALFVVGAWFMAQRSNLLRNETQFGGNRLEGSFETGALIKLYLGNLLMIMVTLGLFIPFAAIRLQRYNAQHTAADTQGLDDVVAQGERERSALGEEIGEVFDLDIGL